MHFYRKPRYIGFFKDGMMTNSAMVWGEKKGAYIVEYLDYFDMVFLCSSGASPSENPDDARLCSLEELEKERLDEMPCMMYKTFRPLREGFIRSGHLG